MTSIEAILLMLVIKPLYVLTYYLVVGTLEWLASKLPNGKIKEILLRRY